MLLYIHIHIYIIANRNSHQMAEFNGCSFAVTFIVLSHHVTSFRRMRNRMITLYDIKQMDKVVQTLAFEISSPLVIKNSFRVYNNTILIHSPFEEFCSSISCENCY